MIQREYNCRITDDQLDLIGQLPWFVRLLVGESTAAIEREEIEKALRAMRIEFGESAQTHEILLDADWKRVEKAVGRLIAWHVADTHATLLSRHREVWGGAVLSSADALRWLLRESSGEAESLGGSPAKWLDADAGADDSWENVKAYLNQSAEARAASILHGDLRNWPFGVSPIDTLIFRDEQEGPVTVMVYKLGGKLWRLKLVCQSLSDSYKWSERDALSFVMCGVEPTISSFTMNVAGSGFVSMPDCPPDPSLPMVPTRLGRVTIVIDPAISPRTLMHHYTDVRQRILPFNRAVSEKHVALALFAFDPVRKGREWRDLTAEWNRTEAQKYPDENGKPFAYTKVSLFREHCETARTRLLYPGMPDRKRPGGGKSGQEKS